MDYNKLIEKLIKECRQKLDRKKYDRYTSILNKLNESLSNHEKLFEITDEDIELIGNKEFLICLTGIKILLQQKNVIVEDEIVNFIKKTINKINFKLEEDEEIKEFKHNNERLDNIHNSLLSDFIENEDLILEFIKECFEKNMIDVETSVKLIFYITSLKLNQITNVNNDKIKDENDDFIITENRENISERLIELFSKYGYDYNKLDNKTKRNLEKYGKIYNCEKVLDFLKSNNLTEEILLSYQGIISKILIFPDNEVLNNIDNFLKNNSCTLSTILPFGGIFFSRTRNFQFRNKNDELYLPPKNGFCAPCGQYRSFLFCIELYKKAKGKPADYRMTDEDFVKENNVSMKTFFNTPEDKIKRNLYLLKKYGYINEGELPKALVALAGKNTEYLLDRLIEAGLYEYGKRYSSILIENDFPFRWYKIKRAIDLKQSLFDRGGIRSKLKNDNKSYMGINWSTDKKNQIIEQQPMEMHDLVIGNRTLPDFKRRELLHDLPVDIRKDLLPDEVALNEFNHFYEYSVFTPSDIYGFYTKKPAKYGSTDFYSRSAFPSKEKGDLIEVLFKLDYKDDFDESTSIDEYYIQLLDEKYKINNLTYCFKKEGTENWPDVNILISRPKVIRLVNLLKKNNAWIDEKTSELDKENLLLSIVVKDTVLSRNDLNVMRMMIHETLIMSNQNKVGRGFNNARFS